MKGHMQDGKFHPHTVSRKKRMPSKDMLTPTGGVKVHLSKHTEGARFKRDTQSLEKMFDLKPRKVTKEDEDFEYRQFSTILLNDVTNWGFGDIGTATDKALSVNLDAKELAEIVESFHEDTETEYENIDVVAVLYDHILQNARNKIDSVLKYDFLNDFSGDGTEFYVAGNFMATTYDYSQSAHDELKEKIMNANQMQLKELSNDVFVRSFLTDVEVFN